MNAVEDGLLLLMDVALTACTHSMVAPSQTSPAEEAVLPSQSPSPPGGELLSQTPQTGVAALPFPDQLLQDDEYEIIHIEIEKMKVSQLRQLTSRYGLIAMQRRKDAYLDVLRKFSADRDAWALSMKKTKTRPHKGPTRVSNSEAGCEEAEVEIGDSSNPGGKKRVKRSTIRREQIMAHVAYPRAAPPQRSKDTRTIAQVNQMAEWARETAAMTRARRAKIQSLHTSSSSTSTTSRPPAECVSAEITPLVNIQHQPTAHFVTLMASSSHIQDPSTIRPLHISNTDVQSQPVDSDLLHELCGHLEQIYQMLGAKDNDPNLSPTIEERGDLPLVLQPSKPGNSEARHTSRMLTVNLKSGPLHFSIQEIPDPPHVSFAESLTLEDLDSMWDDSGLSANGENSSPVRIRNTSIAIMHWLDVFRYRHDRKWSGIKQNWSTWKYPVVEYRRLGPEVFWKTYTLHGNRLPISSIIQHLKQNRIARDAELARQARLIYGSRFDTIFTYRKGGESTPRVMVKDSAIARRFEALQASEYLLGIP